MADFPPQVCDKMAVKVGNEALAEDCRPLAVTDAPVLGVLIVGSLLLLPDLLAIEIFGAASASGG